MNLDLSSVTRSAGVEMEKRATDKFGVAVEDYVRGGLGLPGRSAARGTQVGTRDTNQWYASSYAAALAGATDYRPKLKFLFKVQFKFNNAKIQEIGPQIGPAAMAAFERLQRNEFTFMVKTIDRPKVDFEYEDDVNAYNYRTKVLKRIRHRELTVTFMDDTGNRVFDFFRLLLAVSSPITRGAFQRIDPFEWPDVKSIQSALGMSFNTTGQSRDSHRAVVDAAAGEIIEAIRVRQVFVNPSQFEAKNGGVRGVKEVLYDFAAPRLVSFDLDELSHESSEANLLTMQFDYDWMEMATVDDASTDGFRQVVTTPNVNGAPSDILQGVGRSSSDGFVKASAGKGGEGVVGSILRGGAQAAQGRLTNLTAGAVNRAVESIAGKGRLGSVIGSAIGGPVSGLVQAKTRDLASGLFTTPGASTARATAPVLSDSANLTGASSSFSQSSNAVSNVNPAPGG